MVSISQLAYAIDECSTISELTELLSTVSDLRLTVDQILLKAYQRAGDLSSAFVLGGGVDTSRICDHQRGEDHNGRELRGCPRHNPQSESTGV
jgi:cobalamin biosynthesis protein CbiG